MHAILARIHARFASRPDSEHGQALVRIAVLSVVLLYLLLSRAHGSNEANHHGYLVVLGMVAFGFTIGAMLLGWIFLRPGVSHLRRALEPAAAARADPSLRETVKPVQEPLSGCLAVPCIHPSLDVRGIFHASGPPERVHPSCVSPGLLQPCIPGCQGVDAPAEGIVYTTPVRRRNPGECRRQGAVCDAAGVHAIRTVGDPERPLRLRHRRRELTRIREDLRFERLEPVGNQRVAAKLLANLFRLRDLFPGLLEIAQEIVRPAEHPVRQVHVHTVARLVRAQFLSIREKEFVEAARALGASPVRQVVRHILPNALGPVIIAGTIDVAAAIIAESTLSFLGLGFPPDTPTWGRLLYDAKDFLDIGPHWALFPGGAIFIAVVAINFIGDGLRDALDPRKVM